MTTFGLKVFITVLIIKLPNICVYMLMNVYAYAGEYVYISASIYTWTMMKSEKKILCKTIWEHPNNVLSSISMTKILHLESHMLVNVCALVCK